MPHSNIHNKEAVKTPTANNRLSIRLVTATLIYSLCVASIVSAVHIYFAYEQAVNNAKMQFSQIEKAFVPDLIAGLWAVDEDRIDTLLTSIIQLPNIGFVSVIDDKGHKWEKETKDTTPNSSNKNDFKEYPLIYIEHDFSFTLGKLYVSLDKKNILEDVKDKSLSIAITTITTLLLGSLFVLFIFQRWVTRHLYTMALFAENLNFNELSTELTLNRESNTHDELDLVVNSINHMRITLMEDLEKRRSIEKELIEHRVNLEILVKERTAELLKKTHQLELQSAELEAQNRELDAYAHSVAHDLKTPLTTIVGMSRLLSSTAVTLTADQVKDSNHTIYRTAHKMSDIINALLLLASVRRTDDIVTHVINSRVLAEEACDRLKGLAEEYNASIHFTGDWHNAMGYAQWAEEVWVNYISNAIKYGGKSPTIELGCQLMDEHTVKYWVRDYGEGIPIDKQSELFIQFSRLNNTSAEGHGLGLSIVKRIIERLQGNVGYDAAESHGGIFWFTLPRAVE